MTTRRGQYSFRQRRCWPNETVPHAAFRRILGGIAGSTPYRAPRAYRGLAEGQRRGRPPKLWAMRMARPRYRPRYGCEALAYCCC